MSSYVVRTTQLMWRFRVAPGGAIPIYPAAAYGGVRELDSTMAALQQRLFPGSRDGVADERSVDRLVDQLAPVFEGVASAARRAAAAGYPRLPRVPQANAQAYLDVDLRAEWARVQRLGPEARARELAFERDHSVSPGASTPDEWHGLWVLCPLPP